MLSQWLLKLAQDYASSLCDELKCWDPNCIMFRNTHLNPSIVDSRQFSPNLCKSILELLSIRNARARNRLHYSFSFILRNVDSVRRIHLLHSSPTRFFPLYSSRSLSCVGYGFFCPCSFSPLVATMRLEIPFRLRMMVGECPGRMEMMEIKIPQMIVRTDVAIFMTRAPKTAHASKYLIRIGWAKMAL